MFVKFNTHVFKQHYVNIRKNGSVVSKVNYPLEENQRLCWHFQQKIQVQTWRGNIRKLRMDNEAFSLSRVQDDVKEFGIWLKSEIRTKFLRALKFFQKNMSNIRSHNLKCGVNSYVKNPAGMEDLESNCQARQELSKYGEMVVRTEWKIKKNGWDSLIQEQEQRQSWAFGLDDW